MGTPNALRCFPGASASRLHLGGNWPAGQASTPDLGLRELVPPQAPGPLPHSCRPAGRTGCLPSLQPSLFSQPQPHPLLPLGCARGTPVLAAAKISHQQTARESGEPETGTPEVKGLREGEEEKRPSRASRGRSKRLGPRRKELEGVRLGNRSREAETS